MSFAYDDENHNEGCLGCAQICKGQVVGRNNFGMKQVVDYNCTKDSSIEVRFLWITQLFYYNQILCNL